ncbi:MAG: ATP12 family chaperone protein [Beijerinckiaceae bacterium]
MRDILYPEHVPSEPDPIKRSQNAMVRHALPKRFFKKVTVVAESNRFAIKLDGRGAKTPGRKVLDLPTQAAANLVAAEWETQKDVIDPHVMPVTRIVNTALDNVVDQMVAVAEDIAAYSGSDLVCYRAEQPEGLVQMQAQHWDPVLHWSEAVLKAPFVRAKGILHVQQADQSVQRIAYVVGAIRDPIALSCLHVLTTMSGSCLLALMLAHKAISVDAAWTATNVDEDWTTKLWGQDEEAAVRSQRRKTEFEAAAALYAAVSA